MSDYTARFSWNDYLKEYWLVIVYLWSRRNKSQLEFKCEIPFVTFRPFYKFDFYVLF